MVKETAKLILIPAFAGNAGNQRSEFRGQKSES
jgi:hypothetical protein